ncbi:upper zone of growth plate and cartilage matrix associated a [Chaetodon trifascialis]|uniref:upper zone of growth plate and cartilage matrix associated a n=1 Tax=Chaetodon trifascialis TaxID=109706 RepID=UPI003993AA18
MNSDVSLIFDFHPAQIMVSIPLSSSFFTSPITHPFPPCLLLLLLWAIEFPAASLPSLTLSLPLSPPTLPASPTFLPSLTHLSQFSSVRLGVLLSPVEVLLSWLRMSWTPVIMLSLLTTLLILTFSSVMECAAVRDDTKEDNSEGAGRQVFMPESDASNFFKRRSRRSARYYAEYQAEQRVRLSADERRREYNEEQRIEYEHYAEEERDEQNERSREIHEQLREYHYDGLYPRYYWFH